MHAALFDGYLDRFVGWSEGVGASAHVRRQRTLLAFGLLVIGVAVAGFGLADALGGQSGEATRSAIISILFFTLAAAVPRWPRPRDLVRVTVLIALGMIAHEASIGANGGNSFLWFYVVPFGIFFLLGRREGAVWTLAIAVLMGWVLAAADHQITVDGALWELAVATFVLQAVMGYGLESSRDRMARFLERGRTTLTGVLGDLEALGGLVPICAACKKTRDDDGYWSDIEIYLARHSAAELRLARCPDCVVAGQADSSFSAESGDGGHAMERSEVSASEVEPVDSEGEQARYRRRCFAVGLSVLIPSIFYFGSIDVRAGRWLEVALVYGLAAWLLVVLALLLRRRDLDRRLYHLAAAASLVVLAYELWAGAYGGFVFLWLYSYPAFVFFLLGSTGGIWAILAGSIAGCFLLGPIGFDYPPAAAIRFVVTYTLVVMLAHGLERSRRLGEARLVADNEALHDALARVRTLRGLMPICPSCKRVRDDRGYWEQLERYVSEIAGTTFSHGLCPDCADEVLAEVEALGPSPPIGQRPLADPERSPGVERSTGALDGGGNG